MRGGAAAALAAAALAGCGGSNPPPPAPTGFQASIREEREPRADGLVAWRADWELTWRAVPGAVGYVVRVRTAEGTGGDPRSTREPRWRIEVANGVNRPRAVPRARDGQLAIVAAQLEVDVAARFSDGRVSARRGPFAVGELLD